MRFAPPICCLFCTEIPACLGVGETHRILFHGPFRIWTPSNGSGCCDGGWAYDFYVFRPDVQNTLKRTHPRGCRGAREQIPIPARISGLVGFRLVRCRRLAGSGSSSRLSYDTTVPLRLSAWSYFTQRREFYYHTSSGLPARQRVTHQHQTTRRADRESAIKVTEILIINLKFVEKENILYDRCTHTRSIGIVRISSRSAAKRVFGKSYIYLFLS